MTASTGVRALALVALIAIAAWGAVAWTRDDDRPVDPGTPRARSAAAAALEIVRGRVLEVARDVDNGKWEVTIAHAGREYEVELSPGDLRLLRVDYD
jgi:hypothetical protein